MKNLLLIFLGGGFGSVLRFLVSNYTQKILNFGGFPLGTFLVNIAGCFLIGIFSSWFLREEGISKFLLIAGFCGGFTTFSTFSAEGLMMWQNGNYIMLLIYIVLSVAVGLVAVFLGSRIMI
ncbi:MAG: fluoride efflux transporter CrcB [Weeksellaceae bacterium]|nr:fluoride efflux transporter CrcB [Weeksellaceae bacterium]